MHSTQILLDRIPEMFVDNIAKICTTISESKLKISILKSGKNDFLTYNQIDELFKLLDASVKTFNRFYRQRYRLFCEKYYLYIKLTSCSQSNYYQFLIYRYDYC